MRRMQRRILISLGTVVCMAYFFGCTNSTRVDCGGTSIEVVGITGYVALPEGEMAAGSHVGLRKIVRDPVSVDSANNNFIAVTTADRSGRFALACSSSGEFMVEATATNGFKGARVCSLVTKARKSLDTIVCRQPGGLRGTIASDTSPADFFVEIVGIRYDYIPDSTSGLFVFDSLPSGIYTLRIRPGLVPMFSKYAQLDTLVEIKPGVITDCGNITAPLRASFENNAAYRSDMAVVESMLGADSSHAAQIPSIAAQMTSIDENGRVVFILDANFFIDTNFNVKIKSLSGVAALDQLQFLWLYNTPIDTLPNELSHCTNLLSLFVFGDSLKWVGDSIAQNRNLIEVTIWNCALEHVPPAIMQLPRETSINLAGNRICNPTAEENAWFISRYGADWRLHYVQNCN